MTSGIKEQTGGVYFYSNISKMFKGGVIGHIIYKVIDAK
jgi:hypothetical protein